MDSKLLLHGLITLIGFFDLYSKNLVYSLAPFDWTFCCSYFIQLNNRIHKKICTSKPAIKLTLIQKSVIWIAPGVTPWMTTLPGTVDGANNPGVRLFQYDADTCLPMVRSNE